MSDIVTLSQELVRLDKEREEVRQKIMAELRAKDRTPMQTEKKAQTPVTKAPKKNTRQPTQALIKTYFAKNPGSVFSTQGLVSKFKRSRSSVHSACHKLCRKGVLERVQPGFFKLKSGWQQDAKAIDLDREVTLVSEKAHNSRKGKAPKRYKTDVATQILQVAKEHPFRSFSAALMKTQIKPSTISRKYVRQTMARLAKVGDLERIERGMYAVKLDKDDGQPIK